MSVQDHLNAFKLFAGSLVMQYSGELKANDQGLDQRRKLRILEKAMFKMENELNGKLADIIADAEQTAGIVSGQWLEKGLSEISYSSLQELLKQNYRG